MKKTAFMLAMLAASVAMMTACGKKAAQETAAAETSAAESAAVETEAAPVSESAAVTEDSADEAAQEETKESEAEAEIKAEDETAETEAASEEAAPEETAAEEIAEDGVFANELYTFTIPAYYFGRYEVEYGEDFNSISVYDKQAKDAGAGGFAFGFAAYENPADHAFLPGGYKAGELRMKDGTIYDIELLHPTDVQWDLESDSADYMELYDAGEEVLKSLTAVGDGQFVIGGGTKGDELYPEILAKHVAAIEEEWDAAKLAEEGMSPMYYAMSIDGRGDVFDRIGYAYKDLNQDGIDELLIGEIADDERKGIIYDLYTMADRAPVHCVSGTGRERYYAGDISLLYQEYSDGPDVSGLRVYDVLENSGELYPQIDLKTDSYENPKQPWFVCFAGDDGFENISEEEWNNFADNFKDYYRAEYTPLSKVRDELQVFRAHDVYRDLLRNADYGEDPACVITGVHPTADSVASAIAYAYLLNKIGIDANAALGGEAAPEIEAVLDVFGVELPEVLDSADMGQYILVDHSSYAEAAEGMADARILGIVDRHGIGDAASAGPVNVRVAPTGATTTLVYKAYEECGVRIPMEMAQVMMMGIVSETGNLSKYYTAMDKQAYDALKKIAKIQGFDGFCDAVTGFSAMDEELEAEGPYPEDLSVFETDLTAEAGDVSNDDVRVKIDPALSEDPEALGADVYEGTEPAMEGETAEAVTDEPEGLSPSDMDVPSDADPAVPEEAAAEDADIKDAPAELTEDNAEAVISDNKLTITPVGEEPETEEETAGREISLNQNADEAASEDTAPEITGLNEKKLSINSGSISFSREDSVKGPSEAEKKVKKTNGISFDKHKY